MGFRVIRPEDQVWEERPNQEGQLRRAADVTTACELTQSRARVWRYPPHTRGRRHADQGQEEVFVVLEGTRLRRSRRRVRTRGSSPHVRLRCRPRAIRTVRSRRSRPKLGRSSRPLPRPAIRPS